VPFTGPNQTRERWGESELVDNDHCTRCGQNDPRVRRSVVTGSTNDEAAHRMSDEEDLLHRLRPIPVQPLQQRSEITPVRRDVPTCVVANVDGRVVEVARQSTAVRVWLAAGIPIRSWTSPAVLVLAQPTDEHGKAEVASGNATVRSPLTGRTS